MFLVHVNYLAVLLSAIVGMVIGYAWYGPLFGKEWMKLVGMSENMAGAKDEMMKMYGIMFVMLLLMAYVFAHFVWYAAPGSLTLMISLKTAVWSWLGFVLTVAVSKMLFSAHKKSGKLLAIESGYYLVTLLAMGVIFAFLK